MTPEQTPAIVEAGPPATEAPDAELVEFLGGEVESDAPPTESKAPAEAEQPDTQDGDQPRDPKGRFAKADAPAATDEPPAETPAETPEVAPPEPKPTKPFSYRAYGADHTPFQGAVETDEGVLFPKDAVPTLRQFLAEGHQAESRRRQFEHQHQAKLGSARRSNATLVEQANITLQRLAELRRNPDVLRQFLGEDLERNWAILEAEVERDAIKAQLAEQQRTSEERAIQQQAEALRPVMRQTLEQHVGAMIRAEAELQGLDVAKMSERLWGTFFDRVFIEAPQDDPNGRFRKGEVLIDYDAIRAELQYEASLRRPTMQAPVQPVSKAPEPAKPQQKAVVPPPVVTAKGAGAKAAPKVPKFKSTADADAWFESGGYNDLA